MVTPPPPDEPELTEADKIQRANYEPSSVRLGGFLQTQYRLRQDSPGLSDTNGFRLARARLIAAGETRSGNLELSAFVEAELQPQFDLKDAYASVSRGFKDHARITVDAGQMRVPISRQSLLSDSRLAFVDKALLASIAPGRDLGGRLTIDLPRPDKKRRQLRLPGLRLIGGVFNGEDINQIENINQRYLYTGRAELTLLGQERQLAESAFGGRFVTIAASFGRNKRNQGDRLDRQTYLGFDISGGYRGLSGSFEYLEVRHVETTLDESMDDPNTQDFHANGFVAQLNYLLPLKLAPLKQARLEIGFRVEEIDRNDTTAIAQICDVSDPACNQSVRAITGVASYYLRMHSLKAQLAVTRFKALEDRTATGDDASYGNNQVLLQVTYRLE